MAVDIVDAILEQLRGSSCAAAFGDTWNPATQSGMQKFFGDYAGQVALPYLVIGEPNEVRNELTASDGNYRPFIADGNISVEIRSMGRRSARVLGDQVGKTLNDAPLQWPNHNLMLFRRRLSLFVPQPETGPGQPTIFVRQVLFDYQYSGAL